MWLYKPSLLQHHLPNLCNTEASKQEAKPALLSLLGNLKDCRPDIGLMLNPKGVEVSSISSEIDNVDKLSDCLINKDCLEDVKSLSIDQNMKNGNLRDLAAT